MYITTLYLCVFTLLVSYQASAQSTQIAVEKMEHFLGQFPDRGPGYGVVIVSPDEVLLRYVDGVRRASTGAPLTLDTPMYIASQTKAYIGLLAARLDTDGVLSLNSRITDHWPDVKFPEGVDPSAWTLQDLLVHRVPIEAGYITFMEAYVTELASSSYPVLIHTHGEKRSPGFRYSNLGYNIWAAILESVTGKSWREWLAEKVFEPLVMGHTSTRTSDFSLDELSWNHMWQGEGKDWVELRPKTDAMMQSAGGLVTSVNDMGVWLKANLNGSTLEGTGISAEMFKLAQTSAVETDPSARNPYELPCYGYALGWNICDFEGHKLYIHGGGYTGSRSMMAFSPEMGAGIGVFSNSDNMTGWLTSRTVIQFFQYLVDHDDAERMAGIRKEVYPERIARLLEGRQQRLEEARAEEHWEGWQWQPAVSELAGYEGKYDSNDPYRNVVIALEEDQLVARMGGLTAWLTPATEGVFGAYANPFAEPEAITFEYDLNDKVVGFMWDGTMFQKLR